MNNSQTRDERRLVVTADDFGLCREINDAICLLHDRGVVHRTSFMVNTESFESSVEALSIRPTLEVCLHLNLTDGTPILPVAEVPTLVDVSGRFHGGRHYSVIVRILTGQMNRDEIYREWRAQIGKAKTAGVVIRQLNAHGHLHLLPQLHGVVLRLLHEFEIPDVRLVRSLDSWRGVVLHLCSLSLRRRLAKDGLLVRRLDRTIGLRHPGSSDRSTLRRLAEHRNDAVELIVHPSGGANEYHARWGYAGNDELNSLLDNAASIRSQIDGPDRTS